MSTKLPKFEMMLLAIFFVSFSVWAIAKCNRTKVALNPIASVVPPSKDSTTIPASANNNGLPPIILDSTKEAQALPAVQIPTKNNTSPEKEIQKVIIDRSILYVTIEGLKLRKGPSLDSLTIQKLPLFEKVYFLDEVTEFKQKINLGRKVTEEPWVKIKTKKGRIGWVYGAGVHYHKQKQDGVL